MDLSAIRETIGSLNTKERLRIAEWLAAANMEVEVNKRIQETESDTSILRVCLDLLEGAKDRESVLFAKARMHPMAREEYRWACIIDEHRYQTSGSKPFATEFRDTLRRALKRPLQNANIMLGCRYMDAQMSSDCPHRLIYRQSADGIQILALICMFGGNPLCPLPPPGKGILGGILEFPYSGLI